MGGDREYWWQGASQSTTLPNSNSNSFRKRSGENPLHQSFQNLKNISDKFWGSQQDSLLKILSLQPTAKTQILRRFYGKKFSHLFNPFLRSSFLLSASVGKFSKQRSLSLSLSLLLKTMILSRLSSPLSWQTNRQSNFQKSRSTPS